MRIADAERRPATNGTAFEKELQARTQDIRSTLSPADLELLAARTGYVIRTVATLANGAARVQHYASLHAATKAQERARARGCDAILTLCKVVPVGLIAGPRAADAGAGEDG